MVDPGAEAVALLSELVSIDSVNPGLVPGAAGEHMIVDHLAARLEQFGFTTIVVPAPSHGGRPSLVAVPPGPADGPTVVLNGHLDTVGVDGMTDPFRLLHAVDQRAPAIRAAGADLMVTVVTGGQSPFVVPDLAECLVELQTSPDEPGSEALAEVQALLDPQWQAGTELVVHQDGWRLDDTGPAAALSAELGDALGTGSTLDAPYWMEAPLWQQLCPTLICGPSGGGLHAVDEWVDLNQVRTFATALVQVLSGWRLPRGH